MGTGDEREMLSSSGECRGTSIREEVSNSIVVSGIQERGYDKEESNPIVRVSGNQDLNNIQAVFLEGEEGI